MKKYILVFLLLHNIIICISQDDWPVMFVEGKVKAKYYSASDLSQQYALIGMYKESLIEDDKYSYGRTLISNNKSVNAISAYPAIYDALKKNDVVILNECHNVPLNRALVYTIIDSFKTLGIKGAFLETFGYVTNDSAYTASNPNIPLGFYSFENIYNQVIHKMKRKNINMFSYEFNPANKLDTTSVDNKRYIIDKQDANWIPIEADNFIITQLYSADDFTSRDAEQALHIYQKMKVQNIQKIFIYCGYDHGLKSNGYMAGILEHLLHKKVFSIDQTLLNEHSETKYENPLYTKYAESTSPFILIDDKKQPIHTIYWEHGNTITDSLIDMAVGSPRTIYIKNRPTWLELNGDRKRYSLSNFIDVTTYTNDFLVVIYDADEYERTKPDAIPEDVFQVQNNAADYDVILTPQKKYHLFVFKDGQKIIDKIINIL
jgi:hypothetical protein